MKYYLMNDNESWSIYEHIDEEWLCIYSTDKFMLYESFETYEVEQMLEYYPTDRYLTEEELREFLLEHL